MTEIENKYYDMNANGEKDDNTDLLAHTFQPGRKEEQSTSLFEVLWLSTPIFLFLSNLFGSQFLALFVGEQSLHLGLVFFAVNSSGVVVFLGLTNALDIFLINFKGTKETSSFHNLYFSLNLLCTLLLLCLVAIPFSLGFPYLVKDTFPVDISSTLPSLMPSLLASAVTYIHLKKFIVLQRITAVSLIILLTAVLNLGYIFYIGDALTPQIYVYVRSITDLTLVLLVIVLSSFNKEISISLANRKILKFKRLKEYFLIAFPSLLYHLLEFVTLEALILVKLDFTEQNVFWVAAANLLLVPVRSMSFNVMGIIYSAIVQKNSKACEKLAVSLFLLNLLVYLAGAVAGFKYLPVPSYFVLTVVALSVNASLHGIIRGIGKDNLIIPTQLIANIFINVPLGLTYSNLLNKGNDGLWNGLFMAAFMAEMCYVIIALSLKFSDLSDRMNERYNKVLSKLR